jgi:hypothetical protein
MWCWRVFVGDRPLTYQWQMPKLLPGETSKEAAQREGQANLGSVKYLGDFPSPYGTAPMRGAGAHLVLKLFSCTTAQSGFGGDAFPLPMVDGSDVLLRGPWHGGPPAGLVEVVTYETRPRELLTRTERKRPWHQRGGISGLCITEDLFARILATYAAHVELARVQHSFGPRLEVYDPRWCGPKSMVFELERLRDVHGKPAGRNWRVYWDRSRTYCGEPCPDVPPHGLMEGATPNLPRTTP